jgi:S-adenosyl methyltransferase
MSPAEQVPAEIDTSRPSTARLYDYYLGGTNNFEIDRQAAEQLRKQLPELADAAWANRGFHGRAAAWMASGQGIRQFIDIGSGLPTQNNTHEVVHVLTPGARIVYVDSDPMVATHSAELLAGDDRTALVTADLRDPDAVLSHPELRRLIDFDQPIGLLMTAVMHFISDSEDPWGLVARYMEALPAGSYLALSHATYEQLPPQAVQAMYDVYERATSHIYLRSKADIARFFDGLEMILPHEGAQSSVCFVGCWGAEDPDAADSDGSRVLRCGVARVTGR